MLYFLDEVDEHGTFTEIGDIVDGAIPHGEYIDEMFAMSISQVDGVVRPKLASLFDLFGFPQSRLLRRSRLPTPEFSDDVIVVDVLFEGPVGPVERASNFVGPPLSFDVLSRFVSRSNDVHDSSFMDLSIF